MNNPREFKNRCNLRDFEIAETMVADTMVADTIKKKRCPVVEQRLAKKDEVKKLIYRLLFRKRWRERRFGEKGVGVW